MPAATGGTRGRHSSASHEPRRHSSPGRRVATPGAKPAGGTSSLRSSSRPERQGEGQARRAEQPHATHAFASTPPVYSGGSEPPPATPVSPAELGEGHSRRAEEDPLLGNNLWSKASPAPPEDYGTSMTMTTEGTPGEEPLPSSTLEASARHFGSLSKMSPVTLEIPKPRFNVDMIMQLVVVYLCPLLWLFPLYNHARSADEKHKCNRNWVIRMVGTSCVCVSMIAVLFFLRVTEYCSTPSTGRVVQWEDVLMPTCTYLGFVFVNAVCSSTTVMFSDRSHQLRFMVQEQHGIIMFNSHKVREDQRQSEKRWKQEICNEVTQGLQRASVTSTTHPLLGTLTLGRSSSLKTPINVLDRTDLDKALEEEIDVETGPYWPQHWNGQRHRIATHLLGQSMWDIDDSERKEIFHRLGVNKLSKINNRIRKLDAGFPLSDREKLTIKKSDTEIVRKLGSFDEIDEYVDKERKKDITPEKDWGKLRLTKLPADGESAVEEFVGKLSKKEEDEARSHGVYHLLLSVAFGICYALVCPFIRSRQWGSSGCECTAVALGAIVNCWAVVALSRRAIESLVSLLVVVKRMAVFSELPRWLPLAGDEKVSGPIGFVMMRLHILSKDMYHTAQVNGFVAGSLVVIVFMSILLLLDFFHELQLSNRARVHLALSTIAMFAVIVFIMFLIAQVNEMQHRHLGRIQNAQLMHILKYHKRDEMLLSIGLFIEQCDFRQTLLGVQVDKAKLIQLSSFVGSAVGLALKKIHAHK